MKFVPMILAATLFAGAAQADEIVVHMLNRSDAGAMVFEPDFIVANIGDTVRFVPTDRSHNAETIEGFLPEGVEMVVGAMNEEMVLEITADGLYGIRCKPHFGMGMVALISVGEPTNLEAIEDVSLPRKAQEHFDALLAEL